eukprot:m.482972 g.482972  ORF g.482972 m.482972 type:complete len:546 (+) comp22733_c0_seq1:302-1939(+)
MERSCMQLSIEGERLLKAHDYEGAIQHFEAGLMVGTDDAEVLSAVYNQLGNACFYANKFDKALEYHKKDLEIAEKMGDRQGQAKAYGNLGNTFKSLKDHDRAIMCCEEHLKITRELKDRLGEGRACYNLGNVHHALGKSKLTSQDARMVEEGKKSVLTAIEYYKATLAITTELGDVAGEGRAVGNLGNAYTALGNFIEAIKFHERRLKIAEEANDLAAKARACGNLGNAYSAQGEYAEAIKYYQQSLAVAKESGNTAGVGQAFYCLGSTYLMIKNYVKCVEYFEQHLEVATKVGDKQGQVRAWYNLRNAYHAQGDNEHTVFYHKKIQEYEAATGQTRPAQQGGPRQPANGGPQPQRVEELKKSTGGKSKKTWFSKVLGKSGTKSGVVEEFSAEDEDDADEIVRTRNAGKGVTSSPNPVPKSKKLNKFDWLNEGIKEAERKPAVKATSTGPAAQPAHSTVPDFAGASGTAGGHKEEEFFDLLVVMQGARLDDQRSPAPKVGSEAARANVGPTAIAQPQRKELGEELDAENMSFFEMLAVAKRQAEV